MNEQPITSATDSLLDDQVDRSGSLIWNRLHSEREDICEALVKRA